MPRISLTRIILPFAMGAICTYALLIMSSVPALSRSQSGFIRGLPDMPDEERIDRGFERIQRRNRRAGRVRQSKMDIFDKVRLMHKRASLHDIDFDVTKLEKYEKMIFDNENRAFARREPDRTIEGTNSSKERNDYPKTEMKGNDGIDSQDDMKGKIADLMLTYNKEITIPKSEHYVDEPIDAHNYKYIHNPDVCSKGDGRRLKVLVIFMVTTAPKNIERRNLIRQTYGNRRNWPILSRGTFRVVFLLGAVRQPSLQAQLDMEAATHGDIVQEDFVDSYANLTLKTVMGLKWVASRCRQATFTMKIDDDSMIHQNRLLRLLKNATTRNFTAAEALIAAPVHRNTSSKYYISEKYFPAPTYPPYLNGPGYILSTDLVEGLLREATTTPLFPWEDVFLGLCLKKLGVVPKEYHDFILIIAEHSQIRDKTEAAKLFRYYTVVSNLDLEYMTLMFDTCRFKIKSS
ncbi:N-acetyllactosaminide beta-1,3-N-acetylglucosaminyltransferase 4-like [Diadema setosum]|uniref:N-acetyllactosaminide beta-1,3-N-acetylglucosaminyltransferase 4-like n=1 Tax=Diadema setosum TaxID=31175 RepID=UPI003B3B4C9D